MRTWNKLRDRNSLRTDYIHRIETMVVKVNLWIQSSLLSGPDGKYDANETESIGKVWT